MHSLTQAAIIEKNNLDSENVWVWLVNIPLSDSGNIRVCDYGQNLTWNGETWLAFPFEIDVVGETQKGEVPMVNVRVSNVTRVLIPYLEAGRAGVGSTVYLKVVNTAKLDSSTAEIEFEFICTGCKVDAEWVTFALGARNIHRRRLPANRVLKNFCRYRFKGTRCGYSGGESTCNHTLGRCRELNNSTRFGGFPGVGSEAIYVTY